LSFGAENVIITLGAEGSYIANKEIRAFIPTFKVNAIDTTAADTYCGSLAVALTEGRNWKEAIEFASAASAISVTKLGAQPSVPFRHKETKIPLAQLALAPMYYHRDLAKSIVRYVFKRMNKKGELHMAEHGYGFVSHGTLFGSDNQLYPLWAMGEWLRITKDNAFLLETTEYYPMNSGAKGNMIQKIEEAFLYIRDEVRIGKHGLIRNVNSDWSDDVHFVSANAPFNRNFMNSESNTNSAMAIVVLNTLADELEKASINPILIAEKERIQTLVSAIRFFRTGLLQAVNKELEGRKILTAYHFFDSDWGADKIFLLPNAFALQIPKLALAKKIDLYNELNIRVSKPEKLGARNREEPQTDGLHYAQLGTGKNGGIWWCPNAQYILGVNTFDKKRAKELFNKTLFTYHAKTFPKYWVGQWTASDFMHSSISNSEGASNNYPFAPYRTLSSCIYIIN